MNQYSYGDVEAPSPVSLSLLQKPVVPTGSRRADQPGALSSGQEEESPVTLALLAVAAHDLAGTTGQERAHSPGRPTLLSQHRELAGTNAGPDLGAGFHPLFTLPSVPRETPRSGLGGQFMQLWPFALTPRCRRQCGRTGMWGWLDPISLSELVYLSKVTLSSQDLEGLKGQQPGEGLV